MPTTTFIAVSDTDVRTCEACWKNLVRTVRTAGGERDLICADCADANVPRRVDLFPPLGIFGLTARRIRMGKHASGSPKPPPNQGPPLPTPKPAPSPPGTPPV